MAEHQEPLQEKRGSARQKRQSMRQKESARESLAP